MLGLEFDWEVVFPLDTVLLSFADKNVSTQGAELGLEAVRERRSVRYLTDS